MEEKPKLLIVDDEIDLIAELVPLLERSGYRVLSANDGHQALQTIAAQRPDLVVLDVLLPGLDGRRRFLLADEAPARLRLWTASHLALLRQ